MRRLVDGLPDLVPMHMRYSTGVALAYYIADGVAISPHAILLLSSLLDWDDIAMVRTHSIFSDPRFVERVQRAHQGSRPSTRQHTTSPNVGVGIFVVLAIAASNVSRELGGRKSNGLPPVQIRGEGDVVLICLLALVALGLIGNEARTHGKQLPLVDRRWRWGARVVLGSVLLIGVLYFIGRP